MTPDQSLDSSADLTPKRVEKYRDFYQHLAQNVCVVPYAQLRVQTWKDLELIGQIQSNLDHRDLAGSHSLETLEKIITGGPQHTLFAKVRAMLTWHDLACRISVDQDHAIKLLSEAWLTEPTPGGGEVLAGALLARSISGCFLNGEQNPQAAVEKTIGQLSPANTQQQAVMVGIDVCKATIAQMIQEDRLVMRFPVAHVAGGPDQEYPTETLPGLAYPFTIMHLEEGKMPSIDALDKAIRDGMPDPTGEIYRLPMFMLGVQVAEPTPHTALASGLHYRPHVNLHFVTVGSLEKPPAELAAHEAFDDQRRWNRADVMDYASFDALSLWVAVRLSRELSTRFQEINNTYSLSATRNKLKNTALNSALEQWLGQVRQHRRSRVGLLAVPRYHYPKEGNQSIITRAIAERTKLGEEWTVPEAVNHLSYTAPALALENKNGNLEVRPEEAILEMYKDYVWTRLLSPQDKVQFALCLIAGGGAGLALWDHIPNELLRREISQHIHARTPLSQEAFDQLHNAIEYQQRQFLVGRWETPVYKHLPSLDQ